MNRAEIDRLVNVWLDVLVGVGQDAGWENCGLLGKIIEFGGQPPQPTGNDISNMTMMIAIRMLREPKPEYYRINPVIRVMLRDKPAYAHAVLAHNFYRGLCPMTNKAWTDTDRALKVKQLTKAEDSASSYRQNLRRGYEWIEDRLQIIDAMERSGTRFVPS
jgi:hypothetical protein